MVGQFNHLQKELAELVGRHTDREGYQHTEVPSLSLARYSIPHLSTMVGPLYKQDNPSFCMIVQGSKDILLGKDRFRYGPSHYLVAAMNLPVIMQTSEVPAEIPNLFCEIKFTHDNILALLSNDEIKRESRDIAKRGINIASLDASLLDAVVRLVRLLDQPVDIPVLAPLFTKEILYKVLRGEHGDTLKQLVIDGSPTLHIQNAMRHILHHFQEPFRVEELADIASMSVPSFHRHFKEITTMSPIQFQKQLRLQEARRLLLSESMDAANAAFRVGYESPTQFSREYSRMFGLPPREDIKRLKGPSR